MLSRWNAVLDPHLAGTDGPSGQFNLSGGNLIVRLAPPTSGAFPVAPVLVYNSRSQSEQQIIPAEVGQRFPNIDVDVAVDDVGADR